MSEERSTGARKLVVGAAAVALLAAFGGVAYAQQDGQRQNPGGQTPNVQQGNPGGYDREDCPRWKDSGGQGASQETEV